MLKSCPNPVDEQDIQLKLHCRLKVFQDEQNDSFKIPHNLISCASRYNLLFVGSTSQNLQVIQVSSLENYSPKDKDVSNYLRRNVALPSAPKHVCVNCDGTILALVLEKEKCAFVIFYKVLSFYTQEIEIVREARISADPGIYINEVGWNPSLPGIFTTCKSNGSLTVYELKDNSIEINELPPAAEATSFCWSPKGKQIAVGSRKGTITQYKPDLKAVKVINSPTFPEGTHSIVSLQWVSNYQFIGVFQSSKVEKSTKLIVIDSPKTGENSYMNFEDICYSGSSRLFQFYMILLHNWNLLMVASANSTEVAVMGQNAPDCWTQWILPDSGRAELPLSSDHQETFPIGFTLDTSATKPYPWGESTIPACPYLLVLSNEGMLCIFDIVNLKTNVSLCSPPDSITDLSGLGKFVTEAVEPQPPTIPPIPQNFPLLNPQITITPIKPKEMLPEVNKGFTGKYSTIFSSLNEPVVPTRTESHEQRIIIKSPQVEAEEPLQPEFPIRNSKPGIQEPIIRVTQQEKFPSVQEQDSKPGVIIDQKDSMSKDEIDNLLIKMITEDCSCLEAELKVILHKSQSINVQIGSNDEKSWLLNSIQVLEEFIQEIVEVSVGENVEVHSSKQNLILLWAWYEEALTRSNAAKDECMNVLLKSQPLDSATDKRYMDIKRLMYYIDAQLDQVNKTLDEQWDQFQDYIKKTNRLQMPTMESVFQTMVRQNAILQKQSYILKDIAARLKSKTLVRSPTALLTNPTKQLEKSLRDIKITCIDNSQNLIDKAQLHAKKRIKVSKVKNLLKERDIMHVTLARPHLSFSASKTVTSILGAKMSPIQTDVKATSFPPMFGKAPSAFVPTTMQPSGPKSALSSPNSQSNLFNFGNSQPAKSTSIFTFSTTTLPKQDGVKSATSTRSVSFNPETSITISNKTNTKVSTPIGTMSPLFKIDTNITSASAPLKTLSFPVSSSTFNFASADTSGTSIFSPQSQTSSAPVSSFSLPSFSIGTVPTTSATSLFNAVAASESIFAKSESTIATTTTTTSTLSVTKSIFASTDASKPVFNVSSSSGIFGGSVVVAQTDNKPQFPQVSTIFTPVISRATTSTSSITPQISTLEIASNSQTSIFSSMALQSTSASSTISQKPVFAGNLTTLQTTTSDSNTTAEPFSSFKTASFGATITTQQSPTRVSVASSTSQANLSGDFSTTTQCVSFGFTKTPPAPPLFGTAPIVATTTCASTRTVPVPPLPPNVTESTTTAQPSAFGSPKPSIFAAQATTSHQDPIFGSSIGSDVMSNFGGVIMTTSSAEETSLFGSAVAATTPRGGSIFGSTTSSDGSIFIALPKEGSSIFGGAVTSTSPSPSSFGVRVPVPAFGAPASTRPSIFGSSQAAQAMTAQSSLFSTLTTSQTQSSIFGGNNKQQSTFTTAPNPNIASSAVFGFGSAPTPAPGSIFGGGFANPTPPTTTSAGAFGASTAFGSTSGSGSLFGARTASSSFSFASPPPGADSSNFNSFGGLNVGGGTAIATTTSGSSIFGGGGNAFGSPAANPFGRTEQKSPFGGGSTPSVFGGPFSQQQPSFGGLQSPFSDGGAAVAQSGFGSSSGGGTSFQKPSGFGAAPVFGASPMFGGSPSFGTPAAFGAAPSFGSPQKVFVSSVPSVTFGSASTGSAGFGNLANQNTIGFANLAQTATPPSAPFSGSASFSNWR